jgi:hypothetical protein
MVVATHGDETESGGTREALGDAPEVGNYFEHIFEVGLQVSFVRIRADGGDLALESGKILLDIWHQSEEILRERGQI